METNATMNPKVNKLPELENPDPAYDRRHFKARHPELSPFVHLLLGTYTTCKPGVSEPINLDEAYEHASNCEWCNATLAHKIEFQRQFIR